MKHLYAKQVILQQQDRMRERSRDSPHFRRQSIDRRDDRSRQNRIERQPHPQEWHREERRPFNPKSQQFQKQHHALEIAPKVNRKETCPFLVRVFYATNNQNSFSDHEKLPQNQLKLHLWMDSSLREVAQLMRCYLPNIRTKQSFTFWRVHVEEGKQGLTKQHLGLVMMHRKNDRTDQRYLGNWHFNIGDYLDVSINYK